eukprot:TRINITY_DN29258_c0_g2_i1.p1 TRINITY_DN29258_c0_g2~~TRINITY_DN29258_c0_g2_i1.p1  ORF type:complete len:305 (+),score=28.30 TRINITY_DN29258_c0_g2_i1:121-915(+)
MDRVRSTTDCMENLSAARPLRGRSLSPVPKPPFFEVPAPPLAPKSCRASPVSPEIFNHVRSMRAVTAAERVVNRSPSPPQIPNNGMFERKEADLRTSGPQRSREEGGFGCVRSMRSASLPAHHRLSYQGKGPLPSWTARIAAQRSLSRSRSPFCMKKDHSRRDDDFDQPQAARLVAARPRGRSTSRDAAESRHSSLSTFSIQTQRRDRSREDACNVPNDLTDGGKWNQLFSNDPVIMEVIYSAVEAPRSCYILHSPTGTQTTME